MPNLNHPRPGDQPELVAEIERLRSEAVQLLLLGHDMLAAVDAALARVQGPAPSGPLDLGRFTSRQIADAVLRLADRRAPLVRTMINSALENRTGRRGISGGQDRVGPGRAAADTVASTSSEKDPRP